MSILKHQKNAKLYDISQSENNLLSHEQVLASQLPSVLTLQASPQHRPHRAAQSPCAEILDDVAGVVDRAISPITMTKVAKKLITNAFIFEKFLMEEYFRE